MRARSARTSKRSVVRRRSERAGRSAAPRKVAAQARIRRSRAHEAKHHRQEEDAKLRATTKSKAVEDETRRQAGRSTTKRKPDANRAKPRAPAAPARRGAEALHIGQVGEKQSTSRSTVRHRGLCPRAVRRERCRRGPLLGAELHLSQEGKRTPPTVTETERASPRTGPRMRSRARPRRSCAEVSVGESVTVRRGCEKVPDTSNSCRVAVVKPPGGIDLTMSAALVAEELAGGSMAATNTSAETTLFAQAVPISKAISAAASTVVTIMGHVKIHALLDYIVPRETKQPAAWRSRHGSVYHIKTPKGVRGGLNLPATRHFSSMRARGTVTVVLVAALTEPLRQPMEQCSTHTNSARSRRNRQDGQARSESGQRGAKLSYEGGPPKKMGRRNVHKSQEKPTARHGATARCDTWLRPKVVEKAAPDGRSSRDRSKPRRGPRPGPRHYWHGAAISLVCTSSTAACARCSSERPAMSVPSIRAGARRLCSIKRRRPATSASRKKHNSSSSASRESPWPSKATAWNVVSADGPGQDRALN